MYPQNTNQTCHQLDYEALNFNSPILSALRIKSLSRAFNLTPTNLLFFSRLPVEIQIKS